MPNKKTITQAFIERFQKKPPVIVRAPGRVNLLGEHTDYNDGFVLPMAIDRATWLALQPRTDQKVIIHSLDFHDTGTFDLNEFKNEGAGWLEYAKAVAWSMQADNMSIKGWEGVAASDIPIGAGLASSAAFIMAVTRAFAEVSKLRWNEKSAAALGLKAEREWIGVDCGIMDQMVISLAKTGYAFFLDCRSLKYDHIRFPFNIQMVVMDTTSRHELVSSVYNERHEQCTKAAQLMGVRSLREVSPQHFDHLSMNLDETLLRRARHVVNENFRVVEAVPALMFGNATRFGQLLRESHASLKEDFEVSTRSLNQIVEIAQEHSACFGARMTGAGFGGCAIAAVRKGGVKDFMTFVSRQYLLATGTSPVLYTCAANQGTSTA